MSLLRFLPLLPLIVLISCKQKNNEKQGPPNIILMVGDGMGVSQVTTAYYFNEEGKEPNFSRFPFTGFSKTRSSSHKITDSAAGATAFSAGKKTYNGAISMDIDSSTALPTILEAALSQGWKTALIATSSITHATPASFFAHVPLRKMEEEIAAFMLQNQVDFFVGGGRDFFTKRKDQRNLIHELQALNYLIDTLALPQNYNWDLDKKYGYLLADVGMQPKHKGRGDVLSEATNAALSYLENSKQSFFMMIEGSQIDWGGHANDGEYIVAETLDFDKAIGIALDYAEKQGNTLVIVTADHECGGFALSSVEKMVPFRGKQRDYNDLQFTFTSGGHTPAHVPVYAYGPFAEKLTGTFHNTHIYDVMMQAADF